MPRAQLLDGTAVANSIRAEAAADVDAGVAVGMRPPMLATVLVGDDPASATYVRMKQRACESTGITSRLECLDASTTTDQLVDQLGALSEDPEVDGILLQHPVPDHVDERAAFEAISPSKDVDGVTVGSFGSMAFGLDGFKSCTPAGMIALLDAYEVPIEGRHAVVVGRSPILGKPAGMLLLNRHATVTYCHSRTEDVAARVATGDIVVAAVGSPRFVRGEWIKQGAVVLDAGYNEDNIGDVAFEEAADRASWITPVPGGVGPMTIAMLMSQTVDAWHGHISQSA